MSDSLSTEDSDSRLERIVRPEFEEFGDDPPRDNPISSLNSIHSENGNGELFYRNSSSSEGSSLSSQSSFGENEKISGMTELAKLVYVFAEKRQARLLDDFNEFLISCGMVPLSSEKDQLTAKILYQIGVDLCTTGLQDLHFLTKAHRRDLRYQYNLVDGEPSINYDWLLSVTKYAEESVFTICGMFCQHHYPGNYVKSNGGTLLRQRSEQFLFFMHFFVRLPIYDNETEAIQHVPLTLHCPFCLLTGNHFPNECHLKHSRRQKDAHLEGYCKRCNKGPFCSGLHEEELLCFACVQPGYETETCPCSDEANEQTYYRLKCVSVALRGWDTEMIRKLFLEQKNWYSRKKKDNKFAKKFVFYEDFMRHQKKFHRSFWKIFDDDEEPQASNDSTNSSSTDSGEEASDNE